MVKRALVTGITGQDGPYLAKYLISKGYKVFGTYRRVSTPNFWRLQQLGLMNKITLIPADLTDMASMLEAVKISEPHEVYNLAAQSFVGGSFDQPLLTTDIDAGGPTRFLEIIRHINKEIKFYQASTSELYGAFAGELQDENSPMLPNSPYAAAKMYSYNMTRIYRDSYGMFAANGILFNHESPLRGLEFVTRKITNSVARIKLGLQKDLKLGNLHAKRDWGFAPEYVKAMWGMLQHKTPDDFVVATGETHSVGEFAQKAFEAVDLNWKEYVVTDKKLLRPLDVHQLCGNPAKAEKVLGWKPKTKFESLVKIMTDSDLKLWKKHLAGEPFPWDAPNHSHNLDVISRNVTRDAKREAKIVKVRKAFGKLRKR